jgi:hypothetical protein
MTEFTGRWHPPLTTDLEKLEDRGNQKAAFGELDDDHPPKANSDEISTVTLEEVLDQYDQNRPENIQIINPERK